MGKATKVTLILATIAVAACTACMQTHLIADGTQSHKVAESFIQFMALLGLLKTKPLFGAGDQASDKGSGSGTSAAAAVFLPFLFVSALLCSGCPGAGGIAKQIAYDSAACAVGQVPAAVQDTVGQATLSLTGASGAPSWGDFAQGDLLKYGINAAICIVEAAIHDIDAATAGTKGQIAPTYVTGHQRAVDWLAQHGVKHDHAGTMHAMSVDARLRAPELFAIAEVCDNRTDHGSALCRPVECGDEDVACVDMALSSGRSARIHDGASRAPLLVFLDKDMAPRVVTESARR